MQMPDKDYILTLKDFIDIQEWQKIQDDFSAITGVGVRTLDFKGLAFTRISGEPRLCSELLKNHWAREEICGSCLPTFLGGSRTVDKNLSFSCHSGLHNFIAPLRASNRVFGYIIVGPVILIARKPREQYREITEELNVELDSFWSALSEIKVMSFRSVQSVIELIKDVAEYSLKLAYQSITKEEEVMMLDSTKLNRVLNALLEVAFQVSGAQIGSIMLVDKDKNELTIRISKGLSDEVVKNTKVRLGNGISGIAAQEGKAFLLDDKLEDNRIKGYLNRPNIASSMVIPIRVEDKVMGVMNLGASKASEVRFNANNVNVVNSLVDLATLAVG
ncbi:MAG: PocR ligand-binding domain-containing protein [Candidatus Omnitrophica bacterium]|nr:PocR ligand-binding domain-containing protein [Candidatus Omnitrophota bacterium]